MKILLLTQDDHMNSNFPLFNNADTTEEKIANIIVGHSQVDEALGLYILDHFAKISPEMHNQVLRIQFETLVLSKLSNRQKIDTICKISDNIKLKKMKPNFIRLAEIRNSVAHDTMYAYGKLIANMQSNHDLGEVYNDFVVNYAKIAWFLEDVYSSHNNDLNHTYSHKEGVA